MMPPIPPAEPFKERLRESLLYETFNADTITIAKRTNVYTCGDHDEMVYFSERGQIKLLMLSPDGKPCLLAIYTAGDLFGELCLAEVGERLETATAMEDTIVKRMPCATFLLQLSRDLLLEGFIQFLAVPIPDQQQVIASLVTVDSEQRL
jgi:CRP/FNR family cyclic AMP-dependent transcriptional regulator